MAPLKMLTLRNEVAAGISFLASLKIALNLGILTLPGYERVPNTQVKRGLKHLRTAVNPSKKNIVNVRIVSCV